MQRFTGSNQREAMGRVRAALGDDALILANRRTAIAARWLFPQPLGPSTSPSRCCSSSSHSSRAKASSWGEPMKKSPAASEPSKGFGCADRVSRTMHGSVAIDLCSTADGIPPHSSCETAGERRAA